jgi:hypothetical protein
MSVFWLPVKKPPKIMCSVLPLFGNGNMAPDYLIIYNYSSHYTANENPHALTQITKLSCTGTLWNHISLFSSPDW